SVCFVCFVCGLFVFFYLAACTTADLHVSIRRQRQRGIRDSCLHWGLRRAEVYLDPLTLLPPWLLNRGPSRLLPIKGAAER
ncbi:hypothetical protein RMO59_41535, partial [Streptomyces alfalfae]